MSSGDPPVFYLSEEVFAREKASFLPPLAFWATFLFQLFVPTVRKLRVEAGGHQAGESPGGPRDDQLGMTAPAASADPAIDFDVTLGKTS